MLGLYKSLIKPHITEVLFTGMGSYGNWSIILELVTDS